MIWRLVGRGLLVVGSMLVLAPGAHAQGPENLCQRIVLSQPSFQVTTPRLRVTFDAGVVTRALNRLTGENHTASGSDLRIPRGLGHVTGNVAAAAGAHVPWLVTPLPPCGGGRCSYEAPMFHHAYADSGMNLVSTPTTCTVTYTGLTNGTTVFANEVLRIDLQLGSTGDVLFR